LDRCAEGAVLKPCGHASSTSLDPVQKTVPIDSPGTDGLLQREEDELVETPAALVGNPAQSFVQILRHIF
jgi:hypothetical protein